MVPMSVLGKIRHQLVEQLDAAGDALPPARQIAPPPVLDQLRPRMAQVGWDSVPTGSGRSPNLRRSPLNSASSAARWPSWKPSWSAACGTCRSTSRTSASTPQAVPLAHDAQAEIYLATPRIQKPNESGLFRSLLRHGADGILVRNLGGLAFYVAEGVPCVADFSLNAANDLAVHQLRRLARRE